MAVAGAMTTAYRLSMRSLDKPHVDRTTYPSDRCTPPAKAVAILRERAGNMDETPVIVQGSDMAQFWALWGGVN